MTTVAPAVYFSGKAQKIDDYDLPRLGHVLGVGEDEIHAFLDVESRGTGFDSKRRVITLFEPHVFYRELTDLDQRAEAVKQGLAYKSWRSGNYPSDSYPRIEKAMAINQTAALRSSSWGIGQVMGFNHIKAGFETVEEMVSAMADDEAAGLEASVNFIKASGLDDELRAHNWAGFARGYNGSSYAKHGYHTKLEKAYNWWKARPDTVWVPELAGRDCPCPCAV